MQNSEIYKYVEETIGDKSSVVILMHDAGDKILTFPTLDNKYIVKKSKRLLSIHIAYYHITIFL